MDDQLKQGKMGSPALNTQPNPNQNQINAGNNNTSKISQPLPSSKRIINKIPLDFNKLKQAGLDRKLAEALSKRNFSATSKIDKIEQPQQTLKSSPSSLSSSSTSSTLATISGETATSTLTQPQQPQQEKATTSQMSQRQPAPQPIKKRSIMSNYIEKIVPDAARSLHVKAMLKNRILNKGKSLLDQPEPGGTTYIYQTPSTTIVTPPKMTPSTPSTSASTSKSTSTLKNSSPQADFTVPIAKADLTVRPKKPPVVLNLLNQLPKHRAKCLEMPTASNPPAPYTEPYVKPASSSSGKSPSPPLIVLENKVLAPNEKIKLSDLRLPSRSMAVTPTNSSSKLILNVDKPKVTQENIAELDKKVSNKPNVAPVVTVTSPSSVTKTKVILNANKLKVSREKLAEMAKEVRQQMKQVVQKPNISESPSNQTNSTSSSTVLEPLQPGQPVQQEAQVDESLFSQALSSPTSTKSLISPTDSVYPSYSKLTSSTPASAPQPNCESDLNASLSPSVSAAGTGSSGSLISPILVPSEVTPPSENDVVPCTSSPKIFSAVDLIAQLTAQDPNYENSFMELSPEELQMSLHFGYTAPVRKAPPETKSESKEDLPIGKILKIQDIDILHATMDVDGEKANVLRISPNAIKLQNNGEPMQTVEEDPKIDKEVESTIVLTGDPNTLRVTKINQKSDKEAKQKGKLGETIKTVKMKKAKINLVSRRKKVDAIKAPVEVKHTQNGHEDENDEQEMMDEESTTTTESQHNDKKYDDEPKNDVITDGDKNSTVDITVHQSESILPKSSSKRDLTQLYHPPKMPKLKHNSNNNNNNNILNESPSPASNMSLIDILTQEPPPIQGEAQVPFRKEQDPEPEPKPVPNPERNPQPEEPKPSDAVGIKNLLNHLKAENISPQSKPASNTTSPSIVTSKSPTDLDKSAKAVPRKKLVKTRPFLAKRNLKSTTKEAPLSSSTKPTAVFPRNGSLLGDIQTNGTSNRVTSSSTSDDDTMFLGFPNAEGKSSKGKKVKHLMAKETDISDDATPDYDETEGEDQPTWPVLLEEKSKTDVEMEESKVKSDIKDSSLLVREESNSLDSNRSWTISMETEEIAAKETSVKVPVKESAASVIVSSKEKEDVSISQESAIDNQTIESNDEVPVKESAASMIAAPTETEAVSIPQEPAIENQTIVGGESVVKVLPAAVETLEDSAAVQESVITNEQMDKTAALAKAECVSPLKPLEGLPIKSKKKSQKNKKEPEELKASVERSNVKDSKKDKSKLVTKEESFKHLPKSKNIPSKKGKVTSDELEVKPKDETPSTSKKNNTAKFKSELGEKDSPTLDSGTNKSDLNPLEENAKVIETSSDCPLIKQIDVNLSKEKATVDEATVDDRPSVISYLAKGQRKSQSPAKVIEQNHAEVPASDLSLNDSQIATDAETQKEDLNDSIAPLIAPKKRGRKPKLRKLEDPLLEKPQIDGPADNQTEVSKEELNQSTAPPLITPKRRGRKPRNSEEPLASTIQLADECDIAAPVVNEESNPPLITPKKRGRKPKASILVEFLDEKPHSSDQINEQITEVKEDEPNPSPEPLVVPKKRGRKPKPRISDDFVYDKPQTTGQIREQATIVQEDKSNLVSEPLVIPKKRGRKSKSRNPEESGDEKLLTLDQVNEQSEATNVQKEELKSFTVPLDIPKKRGRKSLKSEEEPSAKKAKITEPSETNVNSVKNLPSTSSTSVPKNVFNLRLLLISKREQLDTEEELRQEGQGSGPLKCGLCLARSTKADWQRHLGQHYGVGWTTDNMPEFVTRSTIIHDMTFYLRDNKAKGLICRLCGRKLASGLGMVGHLEGCGLTPQRLECPYCKRMYSKLSLIQHQRCCARRQNPLETAEPKVEKKQPVEPKKTVYSNSGRAKRKSTIKAETKLKKIRVHLQAGDESHNGKDFDADSSDYDVTKDHESSVEYESDGVVSSLCDSEVPVKRRPKPSRQLKPCARSKNIFSRSRDVGVLVNKKWDQFIESNYAIDPLYTDYLPSYVNLSMDEANDLLNSRQKNSMRFAYDKVENKCDWRQLKPLEGINAKNEYITYLGAPVTQLEWVPLPPTVKDQYLLCSLRRKMHGYTRYTDSRGYSALMMLLKCTVDSGSESTEFWPLKTTLNYGIRVPKGPVFSFAFMPSGGYMESFNRLGLLALATSSSDVQIYALPLQLSDKEKMNDSEVSIIELNSCVTLRLDMNGTLQDQCTKICWSEGSGHSLLVSGYASGNVALWEISDTEGLNCFKSNNHCTFVPLHYFYFGERNIGILNLHYDLSGPRWLAVGTSTRKMRVYDLINCSQPAPLMGDGAVNNFFKGCITWPPIWETIAAGCSSVFQIRFTRLLVLNPCGIMYTTKSFDYVLYSARDIHYNCQDNIVIVVTENGDLVFLNPRELNMEPVIHKLSYNCRAVSVTELSKLNGDQPTKDSSLTANDFQRDYGVIVKPLTAVPKQKKDVYLNDSRRPSKELLKMTRLNVVRSNLNRAAHSWVAVGAEHGMLRILNFQQDKFF